MCTETTPIEGGALDHTPLIHTIPHNLLLPTPVKESDTTQPEGAPRPIFPISKESLDRAKLQIQLAWNSDNTNLNKRAQQQVKELITTLQGDFTSKSITALQTQITSEQRTQITQTAETFTEQFQQQLQILFKYAETKPPPTGKRYLKRIDQKEITKLYQQEKGLNQLNHYIQNQTTTPFSQIDHQTFTTLPQPHLKNKNMTQHIEQQLKDHPMATDLTNRLRQANTATTLQTLKKETTDHREALRKTKTKLKLEQERDTMNKIRTSFQKNLQIKQKSTTQQIYKKSTQTTPSHHHTLL